MGYMQNKENTSEWALKYLWNKDEVGIVLSGMSEMEHVEENLRIASADDVSILTTYEQETIEKVKAVFDERMRVPCTNCKYCMPCPAGVNIPECFWAYNNDALFDDKGKAKFWINGWLMDSQKPSNCVECGLCETKCPQNIEIIKHLAIVKDMYQK